VERQAAGVRRIQLFTARLKARHGLDYALANTPDIDGGKLSGRLVDDIIDGAVKAETFAPLGRARSPARVLDDANDLPMFARRHQNRLPRQGSHTRQRSLRDRPPRAGRRAEPDSVIGNSFVATAHHSHQPNGD
jgi:hypothetical protein